MAEVPLSRDVRRSDEASVARMSASDIRGLIAAFAKLRELVHPGYRSAHPGDLLNGNLMSGR
jgi:hypothetical protein